MKDKIIRIGLDENGFSVYLELEIKTRDNPCQHWETLKKIRKPKVLSICGFAQWRPYSDYNYCGQINDTIRETLNDFRKLYISKSKILRILDIWDRWHLNDMKAGTRVQTEVLRVIEKERQRAEPLDYTWRCDILKQYGLFEDKGYKYGHGWLIEPLPPAIEKEIIKLFSIETPLWTRYKERYSLV